MRSISEHTIKPSDATAITLFMAGGAAIAVWVAVTSVMRIVAALPNTDVTVLGSFAGTTAQAPLGVDGAMVNVELDQALITAPSLPLASLWSLVIQEALTVLTVLVVVGALIWLAQNVIRGSIFSRTNTRLVSTAGVVGLIGFAAVPFFGNMVANGAFATISGRTFDNVIATFEPFPFILGAFIVGLMSTVFTIGERMQRDTEGLV